MTDIDEAFLAERERIRAAAEIDGLCHHATEDGEDEDGAWERETGIVRDEGGDDIAFSDVFDWANAIVDALNHQPALIAEIRRLRLLVMEAFDAASLAASTHIDYDPDAAHQAVREARAAVVAKLEARKLHPEFERLEQKFDPRGPTPPWFVGGGA